MVMFHEVDPAELETHRLGRRGRVSYPLVKSFLEANIKLAQLDLAGLDKNPQYLRSVLTSYIKNHQLPIKLFSLQGNMYLMRLDLDDEGNPIENWQEKLLETTEGAAGHLRDLAAKPIDSKEVSERFNQEKGKATK